MRRIKEILITAFLISNFITIGYAEEKIGLDTTQEEIKEETNISTASEKIAITGTSDSSENTISIVKEESEEINDKSLFTYEEVYLAAQLMYNEACGEGTDGQIAVAEVLLNRVNSELFPNTVEEVIYQKGQFANNQAIKGRVPTEEMVLLAEAVLNGNLRLFNNENVLYFRNANGYTGSWGKYPHYQTVNHHEFYTQS